MLDLDTESITKLREFVSENSLEEGHTGFHGLAAGLIAEVDRIKTQNGGAYGAMEDLFDHHIVAFMELSRANSGGFQEVVDLMPSEGGFDTLATWLLNTLATTK